jgi:hypothetical protein
MDGKGGKGDLPMLLGVAAFGGVEFNVRGVIQLSSGRLMARQGHAMFGQEELELHGRTHHRGTRSDKTL